MSINWKQAEKMMKKEAKKGLIYLLKDDESGQFFTGTRQFTIRFPDLTPEIHAKLASLGLLKVDLTINAGSTINKGDKSSLLASLKRLFVQPYVAAKVTSFTHKEDKLNLTIIRSESGKNVYVDEQFSSIFVDEEVHALGKMQPVLFESGLVMPVRLLDDPLENLLKQEALK